MKDVTLNQREQTRLHVLNTVLEHQLPVCQAAEIMGVSDRHVWRMLAAYRKEGAAALAHGNRGRRPRNAVSDDGPGFVDIADAGNPAKRGRFNLAEKDFISVALTARVDIVGHTVLFSAGDAAKSTGRTGTSSPATPLSLPRILSATAVARAAARFLYPS